MAMELPDFDVLLSIHKQDPEAFEHFRRHLLREAVNAAPPAHRQTLEELLVRIETARDAAKTPMDAAVSAFRMMSDSMERLQEGWNQAMCAAAGMQAQLLIERMRISARH